MSHKKYVVTAQKPTAVHSAIRGSFTSPYETNLILGKGNRIEVYTITAEGLKSIVEFSVYGTILAMKLYTPPGRDKDSLFLLTTRHKYCVLSFDSTTQQINTDSNGEIGFPGQQPRNEIIPLNVHLVVDPSCRFFAANLYESTITFIIPDFTKPKELNTPQTVRKISLRSKDSTFGSRRRHAHDIIHLPNDFMNISMFDKKVISLTFLQNDDTKTINEEQESSTLLVLYDDALDHRYLQSFTLNIKERELTPGDIVMDHFEPDAKLLIPLPPTLGGVIVIAQKFIRYLKPNLPPVAIGIKPSNINSYAIMNLDGTRILLGDLKGELHLLTLSLDGQYHQQVNALNFIRLGLISIPSCITYLANDVVFIGSQVGDSQLVHINKFSTGANKGEIVDVLEEFPNIGPITDFIVADLDKQGQTQLITCSGVAKNSTLRIIRNGVGLNELATIEISGVKGIWTLRPSLEDTYDDLLVISFFDRTTLLEIRDNAMTQLDFYASIDLHSRTLVAANVIDNMIIQITDKSVRLMEADRNEGMLLDEYLPDQQSTITVAAVNPSQCVISTGFGRLIAFQLINKKLHIINSIQLPYEISCLNINPIHVDKPLQSDVVAVGLWEQVGVCLLSLPHLNIIAEELLAGSVMPRSILMERFENICYLLVALGDGQFYNFKLDTATLQLSDKKRSFLGKFPIYLSSFKSNGTTHVFAASDKPSIIHSRNKKLIYSNVNMKEVRYVTSFNSRLFPDTVALTTKNGLIIGQMEEIQKLHITKIPTIDTPRRISYQESTRTFGVVTERLPSSSPSNQQQNAYTMQTTTGGFELLDDQTMQVLDRVYFKQFERPLAALSISFYDNDIDINSTHEGNSMTSDSSNNSNTDNNDRSGNQSQQRHTHNQQPHQEEHSRHGQQQQRQQQGEYYVLATGIDTDQYEQKCVGRIFVLQVISTSTNERKLRVVDQIKTDGIVDCLKAFQGKLIASMSGKLHVYKWEKTSGSKGRLKSVCSKPLPSVTEAISTFNDYIITGDMAYSIVVMRYDSRTESLIEVAAHERLKEILAIEATDENLYVAAEREGHLFVVEKCSEENNDAIATDEPLLETVSVWHLGDTVRRIRFGSFGMNDENDPDRKPTEMTASSLIFATSSGAIGLITDVPHDKFKLLDQMQYNMSKVVKSVGGLSHTDWRSVCIMDRKDDAVNFIDGDLIESFLDLTPQQMQNVVDGLYGGRKLDKSVEDICKVVEELMNSHP
ncbi:mono-functional DNA-alkylating methyl methanesulfonate N-term-domain-containing protein [Mycotypha africana]|uniref:mono-functional DNA-alkylating methyl methanesulfonate N-term-domain-containing protein n=1 Tax=Mycotypha africana TaxID=64632 RepID=UPI002301DA44|nr:mono-functional DNA-alkylating methyl methanesulfonate N-term-domain-containing protein [Mycotypha africana]KAI8988150.1 mono-functional DNA-alkylating methyl methanesulfonate N-term-domain-containing protein [Mycotypha africana]